MWITAPITLGRTRRWYLSAVVTGCIATAWPASAAVGQLQNCFISFDNQGLCPSDNPQCGATFVGGDGCQIIGRPGCYDSGSFSYRVSAGQVVTIELVDDLIGLSVFFAHQDSGGSGMMTFFDANDQLIGTPLLTNGACGTGNMPENQRIFFSTAVRRIEVTNTGPGNVWIDTFEINPPCFDDADCDDGDPCTTDSCEEGVCSHQPIPNCDGSTPEGVNPPASPAPGPSTVPSGNGMTPSSGEPSPLLPFFQSICGTGAMTAMPFLLMGWIVLKRRQTLRNRSHRSENRESFKDAVHR